MIDELLIKPFLDADGKVKMIPSKLTKQEEIVKYFATKFDLEKTYQEIEVNFLLRKWSTDIDFVTIRRSLVDYGYLVRSQDGRTYQANKEKIEELMK